MIVLAGDIGGTNIRLALVRFDGTGKPVLFDEQRTSSISVPSLSVAVQSYIQEKQVCVDAAAFGVAGPVDAGEYRGPNLPWSFDAKELAQASGLPHVTLVNDFTALGAGIPYLQSNDLLTLQTGTPIAQGSIALIGAGTGLGEGFLTWNGNRYAVHPSEGGHTTFAPRTEREWKLSTYLHKQFGHVSYERILSGAGLYSLYQYLVEIEGHPESHTVATERQRQDPASVIAHHAARSTDRTCVETAELFVDIYGAQAGNLALTVLATGGVYVAGGIVAHMTERLRNGRFLQAFMNKGRMRPILQDIPVHVVTSSVTALLGASILATQQRFGTD